MTSPLQSLAGFKKTIVVVHDLAMTAVALTAAFFIRFDDALLAERLRGKIECDFDTSRRIFTLVTALHWKG